MNHTFHVALLTLLTPIFLLRQASFGWARWGKCEKCYLNSAIYNIYGNVCLETKTKINIPRPGIFKRRFLFLKTRRVLTKRRWVLTKFYFKNRENCHAPHRLRWRGHEATGCYRPEILTPDLGHPIAENRRKQLSEVKLWVTITLIRLRAGGCRLERQWQEVSLKPSVPSPWGKRVGVHRNGTFRWFS